jgi:hypothetical protein
MRAWTRLLPAFVYFWFVRRHGEAVTLGKNTFHFDGREALVLSRER